MARQSSRGARARCEQRVWGCRDTQAHLSSPRARMSLLWFGTAAFPRHVMLGSGIGLQMVSPHSSFCSGVQEMLPFEVRDGNVLALLSAHARTLEHSAERSSSTCTGSSSTASEDSLLASSNEKPFGATPALGPKMLANTELNMIRVIERCSKHARCRMGCQALCARLGRRRSWRWWVFGRKRRA